MGIRYPAGIPEPVKSRMASYSAPQSENELLARLPPTNVPGLLSRDILPRGERVLFETRPGILNLYWGRLVFLALYLLFWIGLGIASPAAAPGAAFFAAPGVLWLAVIYLQWSHRTYALTDQRVIRIAGITGSEFQDAAYTQIHNLTTEPGGIRFDTTPPAAMGGFAPPARTKVIRWDGLSSVPRVYTFVQEAFAFGLHRSQVLAITQAEVQRISATSIPCAYCGGPIDLATLDPANPRCPRCSAPLSLPQ